MRYLQLCLLALVASIYPSIICAESSATPPAAEPSTAERFIDHAADLVLEISDAGLVTPKLQMKMRQGMLFLYNNTEGALLTLDVDFGEKALSCFSSVTPNLEFKGQHLVSTRPIPPGDFASTCFPGTGEYPLKVYGLSKFPGGVSGKIVVGSAG